MCEGIIPKRKEEKRKKEKKKKEKKKKEKKKKEKKKKKKRRKKKTPNPMICAAAQAVGTKLVYHAAKAVMIYWR